MYIDLARVLQIATESYFLDIKYNTYEKTYMKENAPNDMYIALADIAFEARRDFLEKVM